MKVSIVGILAMLIECINYLEAQKYWSCDPNCPLRCNKRDQNLEDIVCCYIPDVTMLAVTFTTVCHFDCANKCYSGGLKIHNKGVCEGRPSSSESDSISVEQVGPTTPGSDYDAFGMGSRTEKDVFNVTSLRQSSLDALEKNAAINDREKVSGRLLERNKKKHHSKKKTVITDNNIEDFDTIKDIVTNDIDVDDAAIEKLLKEDDEEDTQLSDGTRMGKKMSRIQIPSKASVGKSEGNSVGNSEGNNEGNSVGNNEGNSVGNKEGNKEGNNEGNNEGNSEENETEDDFEETSTLPTNDLTTTTLMPTTSRIEVSTKTKHKKRKKAKTNDSTVSQVSQNITEEKTIATTTAISSIVDMINLFPTTVSSIATSPLPANAPTKRKHK